jgi:hypothetical protein
MSFVINPYLMLLISVISKKFLSKKLNRRHREKLEYATLED